MDISLLVLIVSVGLLVVVGLWMLVISPLMSKREFVPYFKGWLFDDELDDNKVFMGGIYTDNTNTKEVEIAQQAKQENDAVLSNELVEKPKKTRATTSSKKTTTPKKETKKATGTASTAKPATKTKAAPIKQKAVKANTQVSTTKKASKPKTKVKK